jgi:type II secretory pathway component PulJ
VAIAIVAIISVSLFASLSIAFHARASGEAAVEPARTAEAAFSIIGDSISAALPPRGNLAGAFTGTDNSDANGNPGDDLVFYGAVDSLQHPEGSNGEIAQIELTTTIQAGFTDNVLVRRTINNLLATVTENPDEEVICRGVAGFNLQYWDSVNQIWQDNWDSTQSNNCLPAAVLVTLQLQRPGTGADAQPIIYTFTRVFPISCAESTTLDDGTDGSSSSGGTSSTGSTGGTGSGATGAGGNTPIGGRTGSGGAGAAGGMSR